MRAGFRSREALAARTGLAVATLQEIETDAKHRKRNTTTMRTLADALGVSIEEIEARAAGKRFNPQPKRAEETRQKELVERASELVAELQTVLIQLHGYPLRGGVWEGEQRPAAPGKK